VIEGLQSSHYAAILVDPPWRFKSYTALQSANWWSRRDVEKHYAVMDLAALKALPVRDIAAPACHLFLWTTGPHLPQAFEVMRAWGFRYSSIAFVWVKLRRAYEANQLRLVSTIDADLHVGLGLTTRKNAEFCLLGRRGNACRVSKAVREIILAPVREHSRKPDEIYRRIEAYCAGPYAELFARHKWPGWDAWGDEVERFNFRTRHDADSPVQPGTDGAP
jgi:N6-adenosine-specific RNA methylase IME4